LALIHELRVLRDLDLGRRRISLCYADTDQRNQKRSQTEDNEV